MGKSRIPVPTPDFGLIEVDGVMWLVNSDRSQSVQFNVTSAIIWQLCDGKRTQEEIVTLLCDSYPDAAGAIAADVDETLLQIGQMGAVTFE